MTPDEFLDLLNREFVWVDDRGKVYDLVNHKWLTVTEFTTNSRAATHSRGARGRYPAQIARDWLKSPNKNQVATSAFIPNAPLIVPDAGDGRSALNRWLGWDAEPGDVAPLLALYEELFAGARGDSHKFALNLLAYHAQNPTEKINYGIAVAGEGVGKEIFTSALRAAFGRYSSSLGSRSLATRTWDWGIDHLLATMDEAHRALSIGNNSVTLSMLIQAQEFPVNTRFRLDATPENNLLFVLTGEKDLLFHLSRSQSRYFVTEAGRVKPETVEAARAWVDAGGGRSLLHYLLNLDLKGWKPPLEVPQTPEALAAKLEYMTIGERIAMDLRESDQSFIRMWIDEALKYHLPVVELGGKMAPRSIVAVNALLEMRIQAFYTPEELAIIIPAVCIQLYGVHNYYHTPSEVARELRAGGVRYLENTDGGISFRWRGRLRQYLVVSDVNDWLEPISQSDFERAMNNFPRYRDLPGAIGGNKKRSK